MTYNSITESDLNFRDILLDSGVSNSDYYIWNDGDPQHLGHPISGNPMPNEQRAILKMLRFLKSK
jgi:hypothetical protein